MAENTAYQVNEADFKGRAFRANTILQSLNARLTELEKTVKELADRVAALEEA